MKNSNLIKAFSVLILSVVLVLMCTIVNAADNAGFNDISNTLLTNSSSTGNNTNSANTSNNASTNNTSNTNKTNNTTNNTNKSNNSSVYNNSTNLPKTGVASSLPIAALVVIFGISAIYAYKKVKDRFKKL